MAKLIFDIVGQIVNYQIIFLIALEWDQLRCWNYKSSKFYNRLLCIYGLLYITGQRYVLHIYNMYSMIHTMKFKKNKNLSIYKKFDKVSDTIYDMNTKIWVFIILKKVW